MHRPLSRDERLEIEAKILLRSVRRGATIVSEVLGQPAIAEGPRPL